MTLTFEAWKRLNLVPQCRPLTRQTTLPTSATSNAPDLSRTTPTGPAKGIAVSTEGTGQHIDVLTGRVAAVERYEDDPVTTMPQLVWLGGMGLIVLAVAIVSLLGIGGRQMFKAETPGPMKDSKMTPRMAETAKGLWVVYTLISVCCVLGYDWAGMT